MCNERGLLASESTLSHLGLGLAGIQVSLSRTNSQSLT